jgi:capsular exopolysaccharide synthesis family protein
MMNTRLNARTTIRGFLQAGDAPALPSGLPDDLARYRVDKGRPPERAPAAQHEPAVRLATTDRPLTERQETLRSLRTELLLRRASLDIGDTVALLSAGAGEGRSLLGAELAIAFAQTGHSTLLVDADLRRPQQHLLFGLGDDQGLAQAIEFNDTPLLCPVLGLTRLSVLGAGHTRSDPLQLLSSGRFASLVDAWREDFDVILFDTPPVQSHSDALVVAQLTGRALVLSRAQHTPARHLRTLLQRLASTRAQVLGAVVSHF